MPKKIITLDTLSEFKEQCDLNYAPIGGGGGSENFIPVLELSNISGTTAEITTPIPLPSTSNTRFFCYLTVSANVTKILTITVTDATSGTTSTVYVANQYLDHMRNSFPMPFMILNSNGTLYGRVWENDTVASPIPLFYVKNGKIPDQIDVGRLLDRQGVNTGVWFYVIGALTQAYSIQFDGANMWNKNGATSISFANTTPLTRLAGDKPTLVHLYKNSSVADAEGRYPHVMWYYDDKESTDGAAEYAILDMNGSTAVINHDLDIKPFSLADGTVVYIENYTYGEVTVAVDNIDFNGTTVACYDSAGENTSPIAFEYGVPTPVLIQEISIGSYIARPLGSASGTVYNFEYDFSSIVVALDNTGADMDGTPIPWLRADGTRLTPIVARVDQQIWIDSYGVVIANINAGSDLLDNNPYIGGTFIAQGPNAQFPSFGRWQLVWIEGNQNWGVKLFSAINSQTINLDMNSVISII